MTPAADSARTPTTRPRKHYWAEVVLAGASAVLAVVTIINHEWIEVVFGVDPDGGNGALEWSLVGILVVAAATSALLARVEWRRSLQPSAAQLD